MNPTAPRLGVARLALPDLLAVFLILLFSTGCSTSSYYLQAVRGHLAIMNRQRSIERVLEDPRTPASVREKLRLVLDLREFAAKELSLPVDGHYRKYADLGRRFVVWNVHSAPEFSLKAKTWWYPMVGRLKYRGFFSEDQAQRLAAKLARSGEDVYVGGVEAYSTLGWFKDPVLNTFVHHAPEDLAEILFHELAHQRLFVSGETDFNEAFATAVAQEATRRWLERTGQTEALRRYQLALGREAEFVALVQGARELLRQLYESFPLRSDTQADEALFASLRRQKALILDQLQTRHAELRAAWEGDSPYSTWFERPLNNAQLNTVATYFDLVPGFRKVLADCDGDLPRFYDAVKTLGKLPETHRRGVLSGTNSFGVQ